MITIYHVTAVSSCAAKDCIVSNCNKGVCVYKITTSLLYTYPIGFELDVSCNMKSN